MSTSKIVADAFYKWTNEEADSIFLLPASGSSRQYFRIRSKSHRCLGVLNVDIRENIAYIDYSRQLLKHQLSIPEIYHVTEDQSIYFIQDLGNETLYSFLTKARKAGSFPDELKTAYQKVIRQLVRFQISAGKDFDYSHAYPRKAFDKQSMLWDLNYFKYYFLKLSGITFNEQLLENDFESFINYLLQAEHSYFLYRDFQSRNIMLHEGRPWFIDFQGGREGALQYDIASLLYDAKADIPQSIREELLEDYMDEVAKFRPIDRSSFTNYFYGYVFIRIMQAMGAYGYRGFYERKEHFLKSIPYAIANLDYLIKNNKLPIKLPVIEDALEQLINQYSAEREAIQAPNSLLVDIKSFSFRKGYPEDLSGNGGGFIFDCRGLPNPGREEKYKLLTGKDEAVIRYFEAHPEVKKFIDHAYMLVAPSIRSYIDREFIYLSIGFGCTGGQHRSVYCAEELTRKIRKNFGVEVQLKHREQPQL